MAITSTGLNAALNPETATSSISTEDKSILGKDDFMKLLLVELQHQDPTEPMDSEKILTQTSQLATLESAENTKEALDTLSAAMQSTQEFSVVSSIGKRADLGSDAIAYEENTPTDFELYFPEDVANGTIEVTDLEGNLVSTIKIDVVDDEGEDIDSLAAGVYKFSWDGLDLQNNVSETGIYRINAKYTDADGTPQTTRLGAYPIESVRFEEGKAYLKLGSNYVALEDVVEVY